MHPKPRPSTYETRDQSETLYLALGYHYSTLLDYEVIFGFIDLFHIKKRCTIHHSKSSRCTSQIYSCGSNCELPGFQNCSLKYHLCALLPHFSLQYLSGYRDTGEANLDILKLSISRVHMLRRNPENTKTVKYGSFKASSAGYLGILLYLDHTIWSVTEQCLLHAEDCNLQESVYGSLALRCFIHQNGIRRSRRVLICSSC